MHAPLNVRKERCEACLGDAEKWVQREVWLKYWQSDKRRSMLNGELMLKNLFTNEMDIVDVRETIPCEKLEKNKKKTHRFNVVQQIAYVHGNREENFHYMSN